jgi:hypothetical protein
MTWAEAHAIAVEHVEWCRAQGMTKADVLASIEVAPEPAWGWDDVVSAVELEAQHLAGA